jgi:RNA polymerase sigma-70 factor (ECF subfamily)
MGTMQACDAPESAMATPAAHLPPPSRSDEELVRRVVDGDRDAFVTIMRRYNQTLFRTARAILKDESEAEDAVQEAYLLAYRSLATFRAEAKLSTWLVRIVANEAFMRLRKRGRRGEVVPLLSDDDGAAEAAISDMPHERPDHASTSCPAPFVRCSCCAPSKK